VLRRAIAQALWYFSANDEYGDPTGHIVEAIGGLGRVPRHALPSRDAI
jgi:hypothetical protein